MSNNAWVGHGFHPGDELLPWIWTNFGSVQLPLANRRTGRELAVFHINPAFSDSAPTVQGLQPLDPSQRTHGENFLKQEIPVLTRSRGITLLTSHHIDVQGDSGKKHRYYPVSPKVREEMYKQVNGMLAGAIIEPSSSDSSSLVVMVKKRKVEPQDEELRQIITRGEGSKPKSEYRFCVDYRWVNELTEKDCYPIPYMPSILDMLGLTRYITTIDLSQAYHQIPMDPRSKGITASTVPSRGLFQLVRMPYGLTNTLATSQGLMDGGIGPDLAFKDLYFGGKKSWEELGKRD